MTREIALPITGFFLDPPPFTSVDLAGAILYPLPSLFKRHSALVEALNRYAQFCRYDDEGSRVGHAGQVQTGMPAMSA